MEIGNWDLVDGRSRNWGLGDGETDAGVPVQSSCCLLALVYACTPKDRTGPNRRVDEKSN